LQVTILKDYEAKTGKMGGKMIAAGQTVFVTQPVMMPPLMMAPFPVVQPATQFIPVATAMEYQRHAAMLMQTNGGQSISGLWRPQETIGRLSMSGQDQPSNPSSPGNPSSPSAPGGIGGGGGGGKKGVDNFMVVPFITSADVVAMFSALDGPQIIRDAYLYLYDAAHPPVKYVLPHESEDRFTVVMPYEDRARRIFTEKVIYIDRSVRPGVSGYISVYDIAAQRFIAILDATALTGLRTAAKSLLFSKLFFQHRSQSYPSTVHIYGSSTQALFHALQFGDAYPLARISVISRSHDSMERIERYLRGRGAHNCETCLGFPAQVKPDVVITATSSDIPLISRDRVHASSLIISVGSASGKYTEVDTNLVVASNRFIDSLISIDGKGEYKIPIDMGLIERDSIRELIEVLRGGSSFDFGDDRITLFVSKGLIIEDYMFVMKILGIT
jgi:ornithine cyclodeaminase/alanine dehydrogenase-like protein (mu-crystallin family)